MTVSGVGNGGSNNFGVGRVGYTQPGSTGVAGDAAGIPAELSEREPAGWLFKNQLPHQFPTGSQPGVPNLTAKEPVRPTLPPNPTPADAYRAFIESLDALETAVFPLRFEPQKAAVRDALQSGAELRDPLQATALHQVRATSELLNELDRLPVELKAQLGELLTRDGIMETPPLGWTNAMALIGMGRAQPLEPPTASLTAGGDVRPARLSSEEQLMMQGLLDQSLARDAGITDPRAPLFSPEQAALLQRLGPEQQTFYTLRQSVNRSRYTDENQPLFTPEQEVLIARLPAPQAMALRELATTRRHQQLKATL